MPDLEGSQLPSNRTIRVHLRPDSTQCCQWCYMHDGSLKTLEEVVNGTPRVVPNPTLSKDVKKLELTNQDKKDLVAFMKACTSKLPMLSKAGFQNKFLPIVKFHTLTINTS